MTKDELKELAELRKNLGQEGKLESADRYIMLKLDDTIHKFTRWLTLLGLPSLGAVVGSLIYAMFSVPDTLAAKITADSQKEIISLTSDLRVAQENVREIEGQITKINDFGNLNDAIVLLEAISKNEDSANWFSKVEAQQKSLDETKGRLSDLQAQANSTSDTASKSLASTKTLQEQIQAQRSTTANIALDLGGRIANLEHQEGPNEAFWLTVCESFDNESSTPKDEDCSKLLNNAWQQSTIVE